MSVLKVGDSFPEGVSFTYVPFTKEKADIKACGMPIKYDASKGRMELPSSSSEVPVASLECSRGP